MGTWLLIASLGMLFGAALVGYLVIRLRAPEWPPPGSPSLPGGVWISTALLAALSAVLILAERSVREGRVASLSRMLIGVGPAGGGFSGLSGRVLDADGRR